MNPCQKCQYRPENNFCSLSETNINRRFAPCASFHRKEDFYVSRNEKTAQDEPSEEGQKKFEGT